jgi:Flp pilus assembly protein TadB
MTTALLVIAAVAALAIVVAVATWGVRRVRSRRPQTTAQRLAAARKASKGIRRSGVWPHRRDVFEGADAGGDRHSAALLENSTYGDGASGSF